jgi:hypothetical protein
MASDVFKDTKKLLKCDYIIAGLALLPSVRKPQANIRFDGLPNTWALLGKTPAYCRRMFPRLIDKKLRP